MIINSSSFVFISTFAFKSTVMIWDNQIIKSVLTREAEIRLCNWTTLHSSCKTEMKEPYYKFKKNFKVCQGWAWTGQTNKQRNKQKQTNKSTKKQRFSMTTERSSLDKCHIWRYNGIYPLLKMIGILDLEECKHIGYSWNFQKYRCCANYA